MTIGEYAKDVAIGGTIGAITGPIGAGGASATTSIASKVGTEGIKQGAVKLAGRTAVIAVFGIFIENFRLYMGLFVSEFNLIRFHPL